MTELPIVLPEDRLAGYVLAGFGEPPYSRRARLAEEAHEELLDQCRKRRAELLVDMRAGLAKLKAHAGDWSSLRPWLADDRQVPILEELAAAAPPLAMPAMRATPRRTRPSAGRTCRSGGSVQHGLGPVPPRTGPDGRQRPTR